MCRVGHQIPPPIRPAKRFSGQHAALEKAGDHARVAWVLGAFYSTAEREYGQRGRAEDYAAVNSGAVSDFLRVVTGSPNLVWAGSRTLAGHPDTEELFFSDLTYDFNQLALFGEVALAVTDRFSLTGGLRWYDFDERRTQTFDGLFADPLDSDGTTTADGVAPRVIASYAVTEATQVNAQVSKGFRLGGINDPLNTPLCTPRDLETCGDRPTWDNETLWNYEVGTKSTVRGGRGTVNVSGFYMDIRNLQATVTAGSCSSRVIFNVPAARSAGLEVEVAAQPTPLFDVALSVSVADARLQSTLEAYDAAGHAIGIIAGIEDGKRLPTTPRFQMTTAATWRWVMGGWVGYLSGVYQHVGSRFTQIGDQAEGVGSVDLTALTPAFAPGHIHRGAADAEHVHLQSGTAGLQHPQHQDRGAQRRVGHRLLHQQRHRRAGVPRARPGAGHARPDRLSDQPAAARRHQHARQLLKRPASPEGPEWSAVTRPGARRLSGAFWSRATHKPGSQQRRIH